MRTLRCLLFVSLAALALSACQTKEDGEDEIMMRSGLKTEPDAGDEVAVFETERGTIVFMFHPQKAPMHVLQFKKLIASGFYDGTRFHRCMVGFMIQGGDPTSKDLEKAESWGANGYTSEDGREITIRAEFNSMRHVRGVVSAARGGDPDSASSQFFIMQGDNSSLDGQYSAFGRVVSGMSVVDDIVLTGDVNENGKVPAEEAVVLTRAYLTTWPIEGSD